MNKGFKVYFIIWLVVFAAFNAVAFIFAANAQTLPKFVFSVNNFWVAYGFIVAAFLLLLVCGYIACKADNLKKVVYNVPLISISYSCLVAILIAGVVLVFRVGIPSWIGGIFCLIILILNIVSVVLAKSSADMFNKMDDKLAAEVIFTKSLLSDANVLLQTCSDDKLKKLCNKVLEKIKYSDPVSSPDLREIEEQMVSKFNDFGEAVNNKNYKIAESTCNDFINLCTVRSERCKLLKK